MHHSNSQSALSSDNQNEFLPNNTNSYESMIQQHTQRRSLILNDHLLLPSSHSDLHQQHEKPQNNDQQSGLVLQEKGDRVLEKLSEVGLEENEENQFLVNENSLKESIRIAMVAEDSKLAGSLGQASASMVEHSAVEMLEQQYKMEKYEEEMAEKERQDGEQEQEGSVAENNEQVEVNRQSIKQESMKEEGSISEGSDGPRPVQASNELHLMQHYDSAMKPSIENQAYFNQDDEKEKQQEEKLSQDNAEMPSQMQEEEFEQEAKQTSLSQIQGLHSELSHRIQFQEDSEEQPNQEQKTQNNQHSQQRQQQPKHEQKQRSNNSLSNLMKLDYFPKQYDHSNLNVQSKEELLLNPLQSEVQIYKVRPKESQISSNKEVLRSKDDFYHSEPHIAHENGQQKQESELMEKTIPLSFKEQYPIDSIKELPRESSKSIIHKINPSHHQESDNQQPANKLSRSSHSRLSRSKHNHDKISNSSRSMLAKSIKSSSSRYKMKSSHQYFNQFAQQPVDRQSGKSKHSVIKSNRSYRKNPQQYEDQYNMPVRQNTPKESELKESQENPYKSPKLSHKLQKSVIESPSNNYSDFHLPQIQVKSRKSNISNHSKLSHLSKKTPSLHIENSSRLSLAESKQSSIKKNTFKLESVRENFVSYSEGIQIDLQLSPRNDDYLNSAVESQVSTVKKKDGPKEIFNTFPETFNVVSSQTSLPKNTSDWQEPRESNALSGSDKPDTVKSPQKSKDIQLQRIRLLKEAKRKRLQRQLQKVKKELAQINARERNMDRIYEQKQKIQAKERQNTIKSREKDSAKQNRLNVENQVIMRIIKEHRKQKEEPERKITDIDDNITKNLMELNAIRKANEEKQKEKKKMQILQRMKKNEMRKLNDQKLVKANNHYVQQLKSAQIRVQSPPHKTQNEKLQPNRRPARQPTNFTRNSKASPIAKNKLSLNYQQKLD